MCKNIYTAEEIRSIKFYQSDIESIKYDGLLNNFYNTPKAYLTLNSLLYDGIGSEITRVQKENHKLSPHLLYHIEEILNIYKNLFSAMKKSYMQRDNSTMDELFTYRLERSHALESLKQGYTISFTSTSKVEDMDVEYFKKKEGLLILQYRIPNHIPYIDVNEVLGNNKYYCQQEVLLPPFLKTCMIEKELTEKEMGYCDINHRPPIGKYEITILETCTNTEIREENIQDVMGYLLDSNHIKNAVEVLEGINHGSLIQDSKLKKYITWKYYLKKMVQFYANIGK